MKKLLLAATALSLMAAPAFAADPSASVTISGTASAKCTALAIEESLTIDEDLATDDLELNAEAVEAIGGTITGTFRCNGPSTITIEVGALEGDELPDGAAEAGFGNKINYTATFDVAGYTQVGGTSTSFVVETGETFADEPLGLVNATGVTLTISDAALADGADFIAAGDYEGTISVTIDPGA